MWKIGDLRIDGRVVLGPMSGYTFKSYRDFMKPFGVALSYSEMVSAVGVINNDMKSEDYLLFEGNHPTGIQLFGHSPSDFSECVKKSIAINPEIDLFDVNMGCPVPKILRSGAGSSLMKDPKLCGEIVREIKKTTDKPVTVKMRLGADINQMNYMDVLNEVVSAGADAVTIHARTKKEKYAGKPHYDAIADLQSDLDIPLIVSGNIYSLDDAIEALEITGATGIMVARGGVGNPFLVTQIDEYCRTGKVLDNPTVSQQIKWCLELAEAVLEEKGEETGIRKLRSIAPKFIAGCHRCRGYRLELTSINSFEDLERILDRIDEKMGMEKVNSDGRRTYSAMKFQRCYIYPLWQSTLHDRDIILYKMWRRDARRHDILSEVRSSQSWL